MRGQNILGPEGVGVWGLHKQCIKVSKCNNDTIKKSDMGEQSKNLGVYPRLGTRKKGNNLINVFL
jgi:hypothetical protein